MESRFHRLDVFGRRLFDSAAGHGDRRRGRAAFNRRAGGRGVWAGGRKLKGLTRRREADVAFREGARAWAAIAAMGARHGRPIARPKLQS